VIIAYVEKGVTIYGLIYDPYRNEIFTAWKGGGAFLNKKPIACCSTRSLKDAVVSTGSPPNFESLQGCLRATNAISAKVRTVRMLGSAALM
jgi:myo-inositol-1(or 4)-monophosphatase